MGQISVISEKIHQFLGTESAGHINQTVTVDVISPGLDRTLLKVRLVCSFVVLGTFEVKY